MTIIQQKSDEKLKSTLRHFLTLIGGILIATGVAAAEHVDVLITVAIELVGVVTTIIAVIQSWKNKEKLVDGKS